MTPEFQLASQSCEKPVFYHTRAFQPYGVFFGVDLVRDRVLYVSANCGTILGRTPETVLSKPLSAFVTNSSLACLERFVCIDKDSSPDFRTVISLELKTINGGKTPKTCLLYTSGDLLCIEILVEEYETQRDLEIEMMLSSVLSKILQFKGTPEELSAFLCRSLRELTGFERAYYCEFEEDGHGYVPAQDSVFPLESILHHHFPASDVPRVVRDLYARIRYRMITDAHYEPVAIVGLTESLDLGKSLFRTIGATHLQYLKNMGIRSSASFSVVEGGALRGLVGFHSTKPKAISLTLLPKIQRLVEAFASRLRDHRDHGRQSNKSDSEIELIAFGNAYEAANCEIGALPPASLEIVKRLFNADLIFACTDDALTSQVEVPREFVQYLRSIAREESAEQGFFVSDSLVSSSKHVEKWKDFGAGLMLLSLDRDHTSFLAFLRKETIQVRKWSGDPNAGTLADNGSLNPRSSFNTWFNEIKGRSVPWSEGEIDRARNFRERLLAIRSNYLTKLANSNALLTKKNLEIENLLSEIHHRVRNNLAIVNSICDWKIKGTAIPELSENLKELKGRIAAIASLHETLYQTRSYGSVNLLHYLKSIAKEAITLARNGSCSIDFKINVSPEISLSLQKALPLGLITHEFFANSVKHAFVGRPHGTISIGWVDHPTPTLSLSDDGIGRPQGQSSRDGSLGMRLIGLLVKQLDAEAIWKDGNGLCLSISLPLEPQ